MAHDFGSNHAGFQSSYLEILEKREGDHIAEVQSSKIEVVDGEVFERLLQLKELHLQCS